MNSYGWFRISKTLKIKWTEKQVAGNIFSQKVTLRRVTIYWATTWERPCMVLARSHPTKATQPSWKDLVPSVPLREFSFRRVQLMGPKCCRDSRFPTEYPVSFFLSLQKLSVDCWGVAMAQLWKWIFYSLADENGRGDRWRHFWLRFGGNIKGDNLTQRNILFLVLYFLPLAWDKDVLTGVLRGFLDHWWTWERKSQAKWDGRNDRSPSPFSPWSHQQTWDCPPRLTFVAENDHPLIYSNILASCSTQSSPVAKVTQLVHSKAGLWNDIFLSWKSFH